MGKPILKLFWIDYRINQMRESVDVIGSQFSPKKFIQYGMWETEITVYGSEILM